MPGLVFFVVFIAVFVLLAVFCGFCVKKENACGIIIVMDSSQNNGLNGQQPMGIAYPEISTDTGTGDIVLSNSEGKNKKWWIIGAVVIVLLLCVIGGVLFFANTQEAPRKEIEAVWSEYYNYLMYGEISKPEDGLDDVTVETWYPAIIGTSDVRDGDDNDGENEESESNERYYSELKEKYDAFLDLSFREIDEVLTYDDIFKAFYDYNTMSDLEESVIDKYNDGGTDEAISYIDNIDANLTQDDTFVGSLYNDIKMYLQAYLFVVNYYSEKGCNYLEANYINCPEVNSSSETTTKLEMLYRRRNNMDYYYNEVYANYVFENTLSMDRLIKEKK